MLSGSPHDRRFPAVRGGSAAWHIVLSLLPLGSQKPSTNREPVGQPATTADARRARVNDDVRTGAARTIHERAIVIDGHNDLTWRLTSRFRGDLRRFDLAERHSEGHTDIPRLREGGVDAQFFAVYVPADCVGDLAVRMALEQIDLIHRIAARYPEIELAHTAESVEQIAAAGRIAALIGIEGGHAIGGSLAVLRMFHRLGARYLTLTHSDSNDLADSATDEPRHGGLSELGRHVVVEANRLGMLIDISHVSPATMHDVIRISQAPVIASHSGAQRINAHARNVPDEVLREIADNRGAVMVVFYSGFLVPEAAEVVRDMFVAYRQARAKHRDDAEALERAEREWLRDNPIPRGVVGNVVDHIDHIAEVAGIDHVGLGSDFDGVSIVPQGLDDVSCFPAITAELVARGYSESAIVKILGGNLLRVLAEAENLSSRPAPI